MDNDIPSEKSDQKYVETKKDPERKTIEYCRIMLGVENPKWKKNNCCNIF